MSIAEYIESHKIGETLNDIVNACAKSRDKYPLTFMANRLIKATSPEVLKVERRFVLDSQGIPSMNVVVTTHKGTFEGFGARSVSTSTHQGVSEYRDYGKEYGGLHVQGLVRMEEHKPFPRKLESQREEDAMLRTGTKYVNERLPLSVAFCKANAFEKNLEPYEYIQKHMLFSRNDTNKVVLPRIVAEVYRFPEFCTVYVIPKEDTRVVSSILAHMSMLTKEMTKQKWTNVDSVLDYLMEKWNSMYWIGVRMHTDGEWYQDRKLAEHMYRTWAERYKASLLFIEDPFDETEDHRVPFELPSHGCNIVYGRYIASDIHRLGEFLKTTCNGGVCIRLHENGLLTETIDGIRIVGEEEGRMVMLSVETEGYEGNGGMVVDVAVAMVGTINGKELYLKIGRLDNVQGAACANRLMEIENL